MWAKKNLAAGKPPYAAKADVASARPVRLTVQQWLAWRFLGGEELEEWDAEMVQARMAEDQVAAVVELSSWETNIGQACDRPAPDAPARGLGESADVLVVSSESEAEVAVP